MFLVGFGMFWFGLKLLLGWFGAFGVLVIVRSVWLVIVRLVIVELVWLL